MQAFKKNIKIVYASIFQSRTCLQAVSFVLFAILGMQLVIRITWLLNTVTKIKNKTKKNNK